MFFLPLFHNLNGAPCLVVGGGATALRKLRWLIKAEAAVTLVAPEIDTEVLALLESAGGQVHRQAFKPEQVHPGLTLVISATNDPVVNDQVYKVARQHNVLVNCVDDPARCTVVFPAIVDRAPLYAAVSSMGVAPALARVARGWIEQRWPRNLGALATFAGSLRDRVKGAFADVRQRTHFWDRLFDSAAADSALAGDLPEAMRLADDMLTESRAAGRVALVGAGPGDPELLTIKALRLVQTADVILYDKLANPLILDYARRDAELVYVGKQGPKPGSPPTRPDNRVNQQQGINATILTHARAGKHVVRLKGGDPFIYGRGGEEVEAIVGQGFEVTVVPGITAAIGAASYAGIPLTYRNLSQSVRFVTGHRVENTVNLDWPEMGRADQTLVIYMGLVGLRAIMDKLMAHGCEADRPVAMVEHATLPEQRVLQGTVADIADQADAAGLTGPTVVIVGEVVRLRRARMTDQVGRPGTTGS